MAEAVGIVDRQAHNGIKRAHGYRRIATGDFIELVDEELRRSTYSLYVSSMYSGVVSIEASATIWPIRGGLQASLAELHHVCLEFLVLCNQRTDAYAALIVSL